jgi:hypothetical protein
MPLPQGPAARERPSRLPHHPHRDPIHRLIPACRQQALLAIHRAGVLTRAAAAPWR